MKNKNRVEYLIGQVVSYVYDPTNIHFSEMGFLEQGFLFNLRVPNSDENMAFVTEAFCTHKKDVFIEVEETGIVKTMAFMEVNEPEEGNHDDLE